MQIYDGIQTAPRSFQLLFGRIKKDQPWLVSKDKKNGGA